jgi:hypothetical protein
MEVGIQLIFWLVYPQGNSPMYHIDRTFVGLRGKCSLFLHGNSVLAVEPYLQFGD